MHCTHIAICVVFWQTTSTQCDKSAEKIEIPQSTEPDFQIGPFLRIKFPPSNTCVQHLENNHWKGNQNVNSE